jgi:hypothetical protein
MQSQPTEVQQHESVSNLTSQSTCAHHGLRNDLEPSSSPSLQREAGEDSVQHEGGDTDALSVSSGGSGRGRKTNIRRLNSHDRSSQGVSPGSRIDEYERSHLSTSKRGDSVSFQIVPSINGARRHISVEQFPNGKPPVHSNALF